MSISFGFIGLIVNVGFVMGVFPFVVLLLGVLTCNDERTLGSYNYRCYSALIIIKSTFPDCWVFYYFLILQARDVLLCIHILHALFDVCGCFVYVVNGR